MPTANHYTRVPTTEDNPKKSGWYDTDRGKMYWDNGWVNWYDAKYWYKPAEEVKPTQMCDNCSGHGRLRAGRAHYQCPVCKGKKVI